MQKQKLEYSNKQSGSVWYKVWQITTMFVEVKQKQ